MAAQPLVRGDSARWSQNEIDFVADALSPDSDDDRVDDLAEESRWETQRGAGTASPEATPEDFSAAAEALSDGGMPASPPALQNTDSISSAVAALFDNDDDDDDVPDRVYEGNRERVDAMEASQDSLAALLQPQHSLLSLSDVVDGAPAPLPPTVSGKRSLAELLHAPCDDSDEDSDQKTEAPASPGAVPGLAAPSPSPAPSQSPARARGGGSKNMRLDLDQSLALFASVARDLQLNGRGERDWNGLYRCFLEQHPDWARALMPKVELFKQKCKLVFRERPMRAQLDFWKLVRKCVDQMPAPPRSAGPGGAAGGADAEDPAVAKVTQMLRLKLSAQRQLPEAARSWDMSPIAQYLVARARAGDKALSGAIDWPEPARSALMGKMLLLHRHAPGAGFIVAHRPFECLMVLGKAELALLASCDCAGCAAWGVRAAFEAGGAATAWLQWTRARAALMQSALELHETVDPSQQPAFAQVCREQQPAMASWSDAAVVDFLDAAHVPQACDVCNARRKRARGGARRSDSCCGSGSDGGEAPRLGSLEALEREVEAEDAEDDEDEDGLARALAAVAIQ